MIFAAGFFSVTEAKRKGKYCVKGSSIGMSFSFYKSLFAGCIN